MKKNKLKLEKFRIAELKNSHKIYGGTGDTDVGGTNTEEKKDKWICVQKSEVYIKPVTG
ncbi:hypothetical protein [Winogradskyella sp. R77965]|uniref:hypothetical protein n=1 Tax=Winogradskyella sp. R77965 TaxID=3093872 RepID=UPI0037DD6D55